MVRVMLVITAPLAFVGACLLGALNGNVRRELTEFVETWRYFWTREGA